MYFLTENGKKPTFSKNTVQKITHFWEKRGKTPFLGGSKNPLFRLISDVWAWYRESEQFILLLGVPAVIGETYTLSDAIHFSFEKMRKSAF
jgi:hypothetical protein